jgi:hypothetical protein
VPFLTAGEISETNSYDGDALPTELTGPMKVRSSRIRGLPQTID